MMHISPSRRRDPAMPQEIAPIAVRPSTLNGISEHMVVSHYENNYGNAVRALNAVRRELAALDAGTPPYRRRGVKREELSLMGSVALHELYFGNLGGFRRAGPNSGLGRPDWHEVPDAFAVEITADFGSASAWRREFVGTAQSLAGGSGWVLLTYSRRQKRFWNQIATDSHAGGRRRRARARSGHVRARLPDGLRRERDRIHRHVLPQHQLGGRAEADRGRAERSAAAERRPVVDEGHAVGLGRGARCPDRQRQRRADCRRAAAGSHVAPRGSDGGRDVARSGSRRGVDRRADAGQAGGRLLLLRLRRRAQRDEDAHRARLRRALRPRRHRGVVRLGRRARAQTDGGIAPSISSRAAFTTGAVS